MLNILTSEGIIGDQNNILQVKDETTKAEESHISVPFCCCLDGSVV